MRMIQKIFRASSILCLLFILPSIGDAEEALSALFSGCATQDNHYAINPNHANGQMAGYIVAYGCSAIAASNEVESFLSSLDPSISDQQAHRLQTPMIALSSGWKVGDKHWAQLHDRFKSIRHYERERITRHPARLLYYFLAADINQGNVYRFNSELRRLMRKVALPSILPFALIYSSVSRLHPNDSTHEWVSSSLKILRKIKSRRLVRILGDQSSMMMAALMPISRSDIHDAASLSHVRFLQLQSSVLEIQLTVFDAVLKKTDDVTKAMQVCAMLKPHIVDAIISGAKQKVIQAYLHQQLLSPVFTTLIGGSEEQLEYNDLYTFFARMYAPVSSKTGQPISYLHANLGKIAQWYNSDPVTVKKIIQQDIDPDKYSAVLAFLPDIYLRLGSRGRRVFDDILLQLSDNMMNNGLFIAGIFHKTTFFQWVEKKGTGAFASMRLPSGKQLPKYAYILMAPDSFDDPASFIQKFNNGEEVDHSELMAMTHMSLAQLEDRLIEKQQTTAPLQDEGEQQSWWGTALTIADYVDTAFTVVGIVAAIAAAPATGGASLAALPMLMAKMGLKKTLKVAAKVVVHKFKKAVTPLIKEAKKGAKKLHKNVKGNYNNLKQRGSLAQRRNAGKGKKGTKDTRHRSRTTKKEKADIDKFSKKSGGSHRHELKSNMKNNGKGNGKGKGSNTCKKNYEAHHAVPVSVGKVFMQNCPELVNPESPFYINGANNGVCLPTSVDVRGVKKGAPIHFGHHKNIKNTTKSMDDAYESGGCDALLKQVECIQQQTRQATTTNVGKIRFRICR